jgi:glutamate-5-semialdehyde dehydrogenase
MILTEIGQNAKKASKFLNSASTTLKNDALKLIADELVKNTDIILEANKKELID